MRPIGRLVLLQVQRASLKRGERPNRVYDPAPLLPVPRAAVTPDGVLGYDRDGWVVDVHHRTHPHTKNEDGLHGVSLGFTAHYGAMAGQFGPRMTLGCAGENLIAESAGRVAVSDLAAGVVVTGPDGTERVRLELLKAAEPCRPFTGWALGGAVESAVMKEHLQFLFDGMRGFYLRALGSGVVEVGDLVQAV